MNRLLPVLLLLISLVAKAQSPRITAERVYSEDYCLGSDLVIDVMISGTFSTDNQFYVVAYANWNNPEERWRYPATLNGNKLTTIVKDEAVSRLPYFFLKIVSTSPETEVEVPGRQVALTRSTLHLTTKYGFSTDFISLADPMELAITATPATPGKVILSTGEEFNLSYSTDTWPPLITYFSPTKISEDTYFIKEATNACGSLSLTGQVQTKSNPVDLMPISISPHSLCEGSEFKVLFNTGGANLPSDTRFKVRFYVRWNGNVAPRKYVDVPARLTAAHELTGVMPAGFSPEDTNLGIFVGIVTENPDSEARNPDLRVSIYPKPSVRLTSTKSEIGMGEELYLSSNPSGLGPFRVTLQTGEVFDYNLRIFPDQTTTYRVAKMESGCGVIENPTFNPLTVVVKPSLLLNPDVPRSITPTVCEGTTVRMKFKATGIHPSSVFSIEAMTGSDRKFVFPAKIVGDSVEFRIPTTTFRDPDHDFGRILGLNLVSSNPSVRSTFTPFRVFSQPFMTITETSETKVESPSAVRLYFNLHGGGPYTIEMNDGSLQTAVSSSVWYDRFIRRDTTFQIAALSNQCFRATNLPAFPLTVENPASQEPALLVELLQDAYCSGDSALVKVHFSGEFMPGNQFDLAFDGLGASELTTIPNITQPGIYKVRLPDKEFENRVVSVKLTSTQPVLISRTAYFNIGIKPGKLFLSSGGSITNPSRRYLKDSLISVSPPPDHSWTFQINGTEQSMTWRGSFEDYTISLPLFNNQVTEFKSISATNGCGTTLSNTSTYFYGVAYDIVFDAEYFPVSRCAGTPTEISFSVDNGTPKPNTRFTLQISETGGSSSYSDLATVSNSRTFRFKLPETKSGRFYIRIKSDDELYSSLRMISIGDKPTATLYVGEKAVRDTTLFIEYGSAFGASLRSSSSQLWGALFSDQSRQTSSSSVISYHKTITQPETFSVSKVWNSCGYGMPSGTVDIKIKPTLELSRFPANSEAIGCAGREVEVAYQIKGGEVPSGAFLVFSFVEAGKAPVKLDSVSNLNGHIRLRIPLAFNVGFFHIRAEIKALDIAKVVSYQAYASHDITLFGDNTISAGESSLLYIRSNNSFAWNTTVQLSDGSSHIINPNGTGVTPVTVQPQATSTYTLIAPVNQCGTGIVTGSATVIVEPKLNQWLTIRQLSGATKSTICNSDTVLIYFDLNGNPSQSEEYSVLLSDDTGNNFSPIITIGSTSPLKALIPKQAKQSDNYRVRLISQNGAVAGSTLAGLLSIGEIAEGQVLTPTFLYRPGEAINIVNGFKGTLPISYQFGDNNFPFSRLVRSTTDTIRVTPSSPQAVYRILNISNRCGIGLIGASSSVTIELLTAVEPLASAEVVRLGPNPTGDYIFVEFSGSDNRSVVLLDASGRQRLHINSEASSCQLDLTGLSPGGYLLQIKTQKKRAVYKIIKY